MYGLGHAHSACWHSSRVQQGREKPKRKKALGMEEKPRAGREMLPQLHPNESAQLGIGRNHLTFQEFIEVFCKRI